MGGCTDDKNDKKQADGSLKNTGKSPAFHGRNQKAAAFLKDRSKRRVISTTAAVLLMAVLTACSGEEPQETQGQTEPSSEIIAKTTEEETEPPIDYSLKTDAVPALNELINTYFEAMKNYDAETYCNIVAGDEMTAEKLEKKGEFVEDYQNIVCYTKPGMTEGSYVVYVYYEVKFRNVDTPGPALIQLYACTNDDGTMYLNEGAVDSELAGYITTMNSDEDVLQLEEDTEAKLRAAAEADEKLALVLEMLRQGAEYTPETETEPPAPETNDGEMVFEERDEDVLTTTTVRVRSTPSTDSDDNVLGKLEMGETLHRTGYNSDWSRIVYKGEEAYISSDYVIAK